MEAHEFYLPKEYESDGKSIYQIVYYKENSSKSVIYSFLKRAVDIVGSCMAILLLLPLLFIVSVIIGITSEGPVIYEQKRVGKDGRIFRIYKFRSMMNGAENLGKYLTPELIEFYKVNRKIPNDPRVTRIGRILRRTSLDELPQLFNILRGDMSIVGPRPMMPEEIMKYGANYDQYITVRPGLTGLWQINCRHRTTMRDRARLDYLYINNKRKLRLDLLIIFKTFRVVCSKKGAC